MLRGNPADDGATGGISFLIVSITITLTEEDFLRHKFDEPDNDYCREAPRFAVEPEGLSETFRSARLIRDRLLVKECGTILTSLAGIPLIIAAAHRSRHH